MTNHIPSEALVRYPILRYFENERLPEKLRDIAEPVRILAWMMARDLPYCPETSAGLRKLLEAKDCLVRAALDAEGE